MKQLIPLLLLAIVARIEAYSQINYFFEIQGNYTVIPTYENPAIPNVAIPAAAYFISYPQYKLVESYESKPGIGLQTGISKDLSGRISFETGLGLSVINFRRNIEAKSDSEGLSPIPSQNVEIGVPIGSIYTGTIRYIDLDSIDHTGTPIALNSPNDGKTMISYLTIPIDLNYRILKDRLSIGAGISTSMLIHSKQTYTQLSLDNSYYYSGVTSYDRWSAADDGSYTPKFTTTEKIDKSGDGLTNLVWSSNLHAQFRIFGSLWINTAYQHSFTPVYESENRFGGNAKNRMIRFGLRYYLSV